MGLLSLLCCGADASNDAADKYHRQSPGPSRVAGVKSAKTGSYAGQGNNGASGDSNRHVARGAAEDGGAAAKAALDDENSVNESDTLTVPNDEPKLDPARESTVPATVHTSANSAENGENGTKNGKNGENGENGPQNPADIITSVSETGNNNNNSNVNDNYNYNGDVGTDADADADAASVFDLSAIQENQAFNPETGFLLGKKDEKRFGNKKCLVLDLDETLVHSSFKYLRTADFVIPVEIEDQVHHVYVIKRPGVDEFLRRVGKLYEVVVFTASVAKYGDPLLNKLDIHKAVHQRLFRDSCYTYQGNFIKNLSQLGRPLEESIIIDNSPASYVFHPQHSVPISSWFSDTHDNELLDLLPLLEDLARPNVDNVGLVLDLAM